MSPLYFFTPFFLAGRGGQGVMAVEAEYLQSASPFDRLSMSGLRQQRVQSGRCMSEPLQRGVQRGAAPSGREFEGCPLNTSLLPLFLVGRGGQGVMVVDAECLQSASPFEKLRMSGLRQQGVQRGRCPFWQGV